MDRQGTRIVLLIAAALTATVLAAGAAELRAARWTAAGADLARVLSEKPAECLAVTSQQAYAVEVGRAAFQTPLLLGGQAARAGLSCESCHRGGRANPDFFFPGASGAPGTVDVTTSLLSSHRGDGVNNPKPIPDLGGTRLKISRDPKSPALKNFIHGVVTEEFDGVEPPAAVLDGLVAYVRSLSPAACPRARVQPVRMASVISDGVRAAKAGAEALARKDAPTALLMLASARTQMGFLHERYDLPALSTARARIRSADLDLASIQQAVRTAQGDAPLRLAAWIADAPALVKALQPQERLSLFDRDRLKAVRR